MFFEKLSVYSRLGIKSVGKSLGNEINEVIPACFVFYEKDKVGTSGVVLLFAVVHTAPGDIHLAANNRLYPFSFAGFVERYRAIHYSVIRYGDGVVSGKSSGFRNIGYSARSVKQAVFAVKVKVYE